MSVFKYSLSAFSQAQNAPEEFEEDIEQISTFFGDFPLHSIKTSKNIGPTYSSFNPCPSLPSIKLLQQKTGNSFNTGT